VADEMISKSPALKIREPFLGLEQPPVVVPGHHVQQPDIVIGPVDFVLDPAPAIKMSTARVRDTRRWVMIHWTGPPFSTSKPGHDQVLLAGFTRMVP